jgi:hypothetical protein
MSPCCDCAQKAHCLYRGGRRPCPYYIGPPVKDWPAPATMPADGQPQAARPSRPSESPVATWLGIANVYVKTVA